MGFAAWAAIDRDQEIGPEHLLLGLLREAEEPLGTDLPVETRRERALLGLPVDGPQPLRRLVEAEGSTLEGLREALLEAMDGPADRPS
jgi:hypothetical protein